MQQRTTSEAEDVAADLLLDVTILPDSTSSEHVLLFRELAAEKGRQLIECFLLADAASVGIVEVGAVANDRLRCHPAVEE